jgi:hypothetical protein
MTESRTAAEFYSVVEKTSRLMGLSSSRDKVWPILTTYEHVMEPAVISFRAQNGPLGGGDLDCRWTMLPKDLDPYAVALSRGLTAATGHPVDTVAAEVHDACPVGGSGFDFGVTGGFKKTWAFLPVPQPAAKLAELPSMPASVADNLGFLERYDLADIVNTVGIDYPKRTVNLYFNPSEPDFFRPENLRTLVKETGLPEPSEPLLRFCEQAFGIYLTLNWDSATIERLTFATVTTDPLGLPLPVDESIESLVNNAPYPAGEYYIYGVAVTPKGESHKIQSYYQWQPRVESMLKAVARG